ncbi:MAG TPA: class I SAM-dependent methyltransferase [Bryobacteraceae bacterium]|nr:class I SAM-dependent methyltransferase [Bryobacteraceae bacterium]
MRILAFLVCLSLAGQVAREANSGYKTSDERARVAATLTSETRDERQKPNELVASMKLIPGSTVADVGTGAGYMLPYLSAAVGSTGKVIAQDIFPDFLDRARSTAKSINNVQFVLGTEKDTKLPAGCCDAVLVLDAYHHFDYPKEMLASIRAALKPKGKLFLVEYHKSAEAMPNRRALTHIRLDKEGFIHEVTSNGFRLVESHDHVPRSQWMATFEAQ